MADYMRRQVTVGNTTLDNMNTIYDYRVANNKCQFKRSQTKWIRFWADWPTFQPNEGDHPGSSAAAGWLDDSIRQARANGLRVMLTAYRFPTWSNKQPYNQVDRGNKGLDFRIPEALNKDSAWGKWIEFLIYRYGRTSPVGAPVDFFEVCNEPNRQMWPQLDSNGNRVIGCYVAQMFQTAQVIARANDQNNPLVTLAGPGILDQKATGDVRMITPYQNFIDNLFYYFPQSTNYQGTFTPDRFFAFTTHNYADVLDNHSVASATRAADIIARIKAKGWTGWPNGDVNVPYILISEGGAQLADVSWDQTRQRDRVVKNFNLMVQLAGVGMCTNHLMYTAPYYDSGLLETNGTERPLYRSWSCLTSAGSTLTLPTGCAAPPTC